MIDTTRKYSGKYPVIPQIDDVVEFNNPQLASQGTIGIVAGMHNIGMLDLIIPEWETKQPDNPNNPYWPTSIESANLIWRPNMCLNLKK